MENYFLNHWNSFEEELPGDFIYWGLIQYKDDILPV